MSNEENTKKKSKKGLLGFLVLALLLIGVSTFSIVYVSINPPVKPVTNTPAVYSVAFPGTGIDSLNVNEGGLITKPADPSKDGYTFGGWYKDAACEYKWDFEHDKVTENTTLYAKWIENTVTVSYTVAFVMNSHGYQVPSQSIEQGKLVSKPTNPTAENFIFGGWYRDEDFEFKWDFELDRVTGDTTLYAKWIYLCKFVFDINFDNVPGTPSNLASYDFFGNQPDPVDVPYGQIAKDYKPTLVVPESHNVGDVDFVGWCRDIYGNAPWDWENDIASGDITLYAGWAVAKIK